MESISGGRLRDVQLNIKKQYTKKKVLTGRFFLVFGFQRADALGTLGNHFYRFTVIMIDNDFI